MNIVLYTKPSYPPDDVIFEVSILRTALIMLLPILGQLQKAGWEIDLALMGVHEYGLTQLVDWLKNLPFVGDYSIAELMAIVQAFFKASSTRQR
jgi:hypothetical protein